MSVAQLLSQPMNFSVDPCMHAPFDVGYIIIRCYWYITLTRPPTWLVHFSTYDLQLPLLDHNRLGDLGEWRAALMFLTAITYAYVWCEGEDGIPEVSMIEKKRKRDD